MSKRFFGEGMPDIDLSDLHGKLIVIEGADGSGRSTQIEILKDWLERRGHATISVGLNRSALVGSQLQRAKEGNILSPTTRSLFYAADFADQLENTIIPSLRAGFLVLADRYIYTLMARDIVRGAEREWVESLYGIAIVPDAVFYLRVTPRVLVERNFEKKVQLDYWESGMDIGLSRDMLESFFKYQKLIQAEFQLMQKRYGFEDINGNRSPRVVAHELQTRIELLLEDVLLPVKENQILIPPSTAVTQENLIANA